MIVTEFLFSLTKLANQILNCLYGALIVSGNLLFTINKWIIPKIYEFILPVACAYIKKNKRYPNSMKFYAHNLATHNADLKISMTQTGFKK